MNRKKRKNRNESRKWIKNILQLCKAAKKELQVIEEKIKKDTKESERRIEAAIRRKK